MSAANDPFVFCGTRCEGPLRAWENVTSGGDMSDLREG